MEFRSRRRRKTSAIPTRKHWKTTSSKIRGEQRYGIIGLTCDLVLLLVAFVDRSEPDTETIHIISARKATKYEQTTYEKQRFGF